MKKALFCILALFTGMGVFAQQLPVVAVAPFNAISGVSASEANIITRVFYIRLGNTNKVSLVDRNVVDRVLQEHRFQAGDWSNSQKTAELGKALNANWIVKGEVEKLGANIIVTVQLYDIQTFRFMGGSDLRLRNAEDAYDNMDPLVDKLVQTIASAEGQIPPGLEFRIVGNKTVTITNYRGNAQTLAIPSVIQGLPVTSINGGAFEGCENLRSITIPSSVIEIDDEAFAYCQNLTSVSIPYSVTSIGYFPFVGCKKLASITVHQQNTAYSSVDGVLFDKNKRRLIQYPAGKGGNYVIPSSVVQIWEAAFAFCENLESITIPSSVTTIEEEAFINCESLTSLNIPSSVTSIGDVAFADCISLKSVTLSRRTKLGREVFPSSARITYRD